MIDTLNCPEKTSQADPGEPESAPMPSHTFDTVVAAAIKPMNDAMFMLENLETEREHWERTELATSHKRLYQMLTKCYTFYMRMKTDADADVREQIRKGLEAFINTRNYKFQPKTHDMNKVVKAVFGVDRRRVSAYSLALRAALIAGPIGSKGKATPITESKLAQWLEDQGGVEQVRLGTKNKGLTVSARATNVKSVVRKTKLMNFVADEAATQFDTDDVDKMMVLIATYRTNGEFEVNAVVKNDTAVNAALAAFYTDNKSAMKDAEKAADTQSKEDEKQSAIEQAAAQA